MVNVKQQAHTSRSFLAGGPLLSLTISIGAILCQVAVIPALAQAYKTAESSRATAPVIAQAPAQERSQGAAVTAGETPAGGGDDAKLPLHGLTGATSLGVYPNLDKGLLITPGAHTVKVSVPLKQIIDGGQQIAAKIDHQGLPRGKFQALVITVANNADRPITFDGDAAAANCAGGPLACVPLTKLEKLSVLPEQSSNFGKKFATDLAATTTAAVTVGWYQTIRDQKRFSGPIIAPDGGRYGLDEQRRQDQLRRFGKRVLWPGDTSTGVIYFDTGAALTGATIDLPVSSYYDPNDHCDLIVRN
jgi:hypothetical protein